MKKFSEVFAMVLKQSRLSKGELTRSTGLSFQDINQLLNGRRRIGPKTLASLLHSIAEPKLQRLLISAFVDDGLNEVQEHLAKYPQAEAAVGNFSHDLGRFLAGTPASLKKNEATIPLWLDELLQEAIDAGEGQPDVAELGRVFKLGGTLQASADRSVQDVREQTTGVA